LITFEIKMEMIGPDLYQGCHFLKGLDNLETLEKFDSSGKSGNFLKNQRIFSPLF